MSGVKAIIGPKPIKATIKQPTLERIGSPASGNRKARTSYPAQALPAIPSSASPKSSYRPRAWSPESSSLNRYPSSKIFPKDTYQGSTASAPLASSSSTSVIRNIPANPELEEVNSRLASMSAAIKAACALAESGGAANRDDPLETRIIKEEVDFPEAESGNLEDRGEVKRKFALVEGDMKPFIPERGPSVSSTARRICRSPSPPIDWNRSPSVELQDGGAFNRNAKKRRLNDEAKTEGDASGSNGARGEGWREREGFEAGHQDQARELPIERLGLAETMPRDREKATYGVPLVRDIFDDTLRQIYDSRDIPQVPLIPHRISHSIPQPPPSGPLITLEQLQPNCTMFENDGLTTAQVRYLVNSLVAVASQATTLQTLRQSDSAKYNADLEYLAKVTGDVERSYIDQIADLKTKLRGEHDENEAHLKKEERNRETLAQKNVELALTRSELMRLQNQEDDRDRASDILTEAEAEVRKLAEIRGEQLEGMRAQAIREEGRISQYIRMRKSAEDRLEATQVQLEEIKRNSEFKITEAVRVAVDAHRRNLSEVEEDRSKIVKERARLEAERVSADRREAEFETHRDCIIKELAFLDVERRKIASTEIKIMEKEDEVNKDRAEMLKKQAEWKEVVHGAKAHTAAMRAELDQADRLWSKIGCE